MKKVSLDVWIQLIGMLSVLAGLLFVGLEMRQSQQIALAAQQQERASLVTEIIGTFSETSPPISFLDFIDENLDLSNPDIRAVAETYVYRIWMVYENDYLQYSLGLMDEGIWQSKLRVMLGNFSRCGNEVFLQRKSSLDEDLVALINAAIPDDCIHKEK